MLTWWAWRGQRGGRGRSGRRGRRSRRNRSRSRVHSPRIRNPQARWAWMRWAWMRGTWVRGASVRTKAWVRYPWGRGAWVLSPPSSYSAAQSYKPSSGFHYPARAKRVLKEDASMRGKGVKKEDHWRKNGVSSQRSGQSCHALKALRCSLSVFCD